jgi:NADP-dependent 3-hydroxy acid dehydrogenase YdfG
VIKNKVAMITGASSGIGYATAIMLAKAGVKVACGARRVHLLEQLHEKITSEGGKCFIKQLDVTKNEECNSFVEEVVKKWGTIDILINNAGVMPLSFFATNKIDEWKHMIDVNILGVLYCTGAVLQKAFIENKSGHIINMCSIAGTITFRGGSVYCATKHAVHALSRTWRQEFSRYNIKVSCIEPGEVDTELINSITDEKLMQYVESRRQTQRLHPENVSSAITYSLNSPEKVQIKEISFMHEDQKINETH